MGKPLSSIQRVWVQSLVRELKIPHAAGCDQNAQKKKKRQASLSIAL